VAGVWRIERPDPLHAAEEDPPVKCFSIASRLDVRHERFICGSEMQCNPIVEHGVLFATTPKVRVIALDAATGKLLWSFNPQPSTAIASKARNRGLNYWTDGKQERLFFAFRDKLFALDAKTGQPASEFGHNGIVDLKDGLGRNPEDINISLTTPGVIYNDRLVIGSITSEDLPAAPGDIRAYHVRTGKLAWDFHTIPQPGEPGYETWPKDAWKYTGAANDWAGMSLDEKRGLVFVPTGSAAFDFYGANRVGNDLYANCLLALNAETGKRVWSYQFVHHDLWDRDLPAPPTLVTLKSNGRRIDAVAQVTKSGHVFVFERETGKPLFPIVEKPVSQTDVPGEQTSATQPLPLKPPPFTRQALTEELLTSRTPEAHEAVLERFRLLRSGGQFVPPSLQGTVVFPGTDGGAEWGGPAFDPKSGTLYVNANEMPFAIRLVERVRAKSGTGSQLYQQNCSGCHRPDRRGTPPEFPSLVDIGSKLPEEQITTTIRKGAGRMPAFPQLTPEAISAITAFLVKGEEKEVVSAIESGAAPQIKYNIDGYNKLLDPDGYPGITPPWGTMTAINLNKGEIEWQIPLGEYPELAAKGLRNTGTENYGGPVVTSNGLLIIAATIRDSKIRILSKKTGRELWEAKLPAAGTATPSVYRANGHEYIVIACGGGKWGAKSGGQYVAFALPQYQSTSTSLGVLATEDHEVVSIVNNPGLKGLTTAGDPPVLQEPVHMIAMAFQYGYLEAQDEMGAPPHLHSLMKTSRFATD